MNVNEFTELSAGHALGALSEGDERAYRAALAEHPEWEGISAADADTAAALAEGVVPVAPPLQLRSTLLSAIGGADAEAAAPASAAPLVASDASPPTDVVQAAQRRNWSRGVFALVASIVLLVGLGWGTGILASTWNTPAQVTALDQIEAAPDASSAQTSFSGGSATVHWAPSLGKVVLVAEGLPVLPEGRTFELWYVRGDDPVSAGTFSAGGDRTTAQLVGPMKAGDMIAVTVEPAGGAPDGKPSTPPLFTIPTA